MDFSREYLTYSTEDDNAIHDGRASTESVSNVKRELAYYPVEYSSPPLGNKEVMKDILEVEVEREKLEKRLAKLESCMCYQKQSKTIDDDKLKAMIKKVIVEQNGYRPHDRTNNFIDDIPRTTLSSLELKAQDSLTTQLSRIPFPDNPSYIEYVTWKKIIRARILTSGVQSAEGIYNCLDVCFTNSSSLHIYRRIEVYEPFNQRVAQLLNKLDDLYASSTQRGQHIQKLKDFVPVGDGHRIMEDYLPQIPPIVHEGETDYFILLLHYKFPYYIQEKIMTYCDYNLPKDLHLYAEYVCAAINKPLPNKKKSNTFKQKMINESKIYKYKNIAETDITHQRNSNDFSEKNDSAHKTKYKYKAKHWKKKK